MVAGLASSGRRLELHCSGTSCTSPALLQSGEDGWGALCMVEMMTIDRDDDHEDHDQDDDHEVNVVVMAGLVFQQQKWVKILINKACLLEAFWDEGSASATYKEGGS